MDSLQVIAQPRRRQILALVWDQEMAAGDIAASFDLTFGAVCNIWACSTEPGSSACGPRGIGGFTAPTRTASVPYGPSSRICGRAPSIGSPAR